jgi:hypothetical protein
MQLAVFHNRLFIKCQTLEEVLPIVILKGYEGFFLKPVAKGFVPTGMILLNPSSRGLYYVGTLSVRIKKGEHCDMIDYCVSTNETMGSIAQRNNIENVFKYSFIVYRDSEEDEEGGGGGEVNDNLIISEDTVWSTLLKGKAFNFDTFKLLFLLNTNK